MEVPIGADRNPSKPSIFRPISMPSPSPRTGSQSGAETTEGHVRRGGQRVQRVLFVSRVQRGVGVSRAGQRARAELGDGADQAEGYYSTVQRDTIGNRVNPRPRLKFPLYHSGQHCDRKDGCLSLVFRGSSNRRPAEGERSRSTITPHLPNAAHGFATFCDAFEQKRPLVPPIGSPVLSRTHCTRRNVRSRVPGGLAP